MPFALLGAEWLPVFFITQLFGVEIVVDKTLTKDVLIEKKLMWQDNSDAKSVKRTWESAKEYCQELELWGYDDWYLPSKEQLLSIYKDKNKLKNVASYYYWSSSRNVSGSSGAWGVYFDDGSTYSYGKSDKGCVRCVRGRQYTLNFEGAEILNFDDLVSEFLKNELNNIYKPPTELKLVKDEFETTAEFNQRVKQTRLKQKQEIKKYKKKYANAKHTAKNHAIKKALKVTWGKPLLTNLRYDADNGYFVADISFENKKDFSKKVAIKVPRKSARSFKKDFKHLKPQAIFDYDGSSVKLKDIRVPYRKRIYMAQFTDINIDDTAVAVNLKNEYDVDTNINTSISVASGNLNMLDTSKLKDYNELDRLLKNSKVIKANRHRWLFVIGIEQYEYTDNISYANRTAKMFVKVAQKKLGVPKQNMFVLLDSKATQADIKNRFKKFLRRVKNGDTIYFYYNGHGVPVPNLKNEPFMLASNSEPDFIADEKFFSLQNIYNKLSESKAKKVVAFVDSCFSGVTDGKAVLKGVAATKMVAKSVRFDKSKMVVLTAGKSYQYSNGYDKKGYRLFSYYIMKNIINGDKEIKRLYTDTKKQTYETSLDEYGDMRTQEPQIEGNYRLTL